MLFEILFYCFLFIGACYLLLISVYNWGWFSLTEWIPHDKPGNTKVSVIVPARNEEENIIRCLSNICCQTYPNHLYEIIVVDDCSNDNTSKLVKDFILKNPDKDIALINLSVLKTSSKKQAVTEAVKISKGELIITTDADCTPPAGWIAAIANYYETFKPGMIIGPVCFTDKKNILIKMQGLEFASLIASGAASANIGCPVMCNGANLAYEKSSFIEAGGFESNKKYSSGDDVFLMHKLKSLKKKIAFIKCAGALVETSPQSSFSSFINQRKRWVSKSRGYTDFATIATALTVYLYNLSLLATFIISFFSAVFFWLFLLNLTFKFMLDFPILMGATAFMKRKKWMIYYLPVQLIYPVYIVFTGFLGLSRSFEWKERVN